MKHSTTTLVGATLAFDRAGARLLAVETDAVLCVDVARGASGSDPQPLESAGDHALSIASRIPIANARAVAGFDDQLWIATSESHLLRFDHSGRPIGGPHALPFCITAALEPAPCGAPAAVWASDPALAMVDDFGQFCATELAPCDFALPLTGRRFVFARGTRLILPSGLVVTLPSLPIAGAVMADGKSVALLLAAKQLITVSLGTGRVALCGTIAASVAAPIVRVANRRGLAIAQLDPHAVSVIELGSGRNVGVATFAAAIRDLAIDPDGRRLATRSMNGSVEVHQLADLLRTPERSSVSTSALGTDSETTDPAENLDDAEAIARAPRTQNHDDVPTSVDHATNCADADIRSAARGSQTDIAGPTQPAAFACGELLALQPRVRPSAVVATEARAQLDLELRTISLRALVAISLAWDTRKLGYGNEGKHPYEHEVGAILGVNRGFAAEYVTTARQQLAEHERALAAEPNWRSTSTPIGALVDELALSQLELDIVLVVAAASLWGDIARLYGILANDVGRATVDESLIQELLVGRYDRHEVAAALDPQAPLLRLGVVHVGGKRLRPFAELSVEPVICDRLRAVTPCLGAGTTVRTATCHLADLDVARPILDQATVDLARTGQHHRIAVHGSIGSGRRTLACALAHQAGRDVALIDAAALPRQVDSFVVELAASLRRAHLTGLIPCVVHLGDVAFDDRTGRDVASEALRAHPGPIVVIAAPTELVPFSAGHIAIRLPALSETERRAVWQRAIADAGLAVVSIDAIAARYKIGPGVIRRAVQAAATAGGNANSDAAPTIETYIRQTRDQRLGQFATRIENLPAWSSVVLPPDILDSLRELVARVRYGRQVYDTWGMSRTMATSRGLTALFQGQPGTGKTLVAGVVARELGLDLYQVDLSKVMSKWIGETERNLSTIFDAAEDGQVVLLFDEADSLFAKRTEVRSSNDRYANLEVNYLLQRLDAFSGIALLTTNSGNTIDQAVKRRLSFCLSFPFPDEETREQLWQAHLPPELPVAGPLALAELARKYQLSGGYIRNACLRAAFIAAQDETPLHQRHLERAVALEFAENGKLSTSGAIA